MNARVRNKDAVPVLSSEAIEVHLQYLRSGLDQLRDKAEKTDSRLDKLTDDLAEVRGYQKALFRVLSLAGTSAAAVSIARTFGWL